MKERLNHINDIHFDLAFVTAAVQLKVVSGDYTLNRLGENFVAKLLNLIKGWELKNLNEEKPNHPAIDLGDTTKSKIAIQVTSETTRDKIQVDTIDPYIEKEFYKTYDTLLVFLLSDKPNYQKKPFDVKGKITFNAKENILTFKDLLPDIEKLEMSVLEELHTYLRAEIGTFVERNVQLSWKQKIGKLHQKLRENVLQIRNLQNLANLYQMNIEDIEKYEAGVEKLPDTVIDKLNEYFFVNKDYFYEGDETVFQVKHFSACIDHLLKQNFRPYFLFKKDTKTLDAELIFCRTEGHLTRIQITKPVVSFEGKNLAGTGFVLDVIKHMINHKMKWTDAEFNSITEDQWETIGAGNYYDPKLKFFPMYNTISQDRFKEWFDEAASSAIKK